MSITLVDIINEIKPKKNTQTKFILPHTQRFQQQQSQEQSKVSTDSNCWTSQQNKIFNTFIQTYGTDFSLILGSLPGKTRKQIIKKFDKTEATRKRKEIFRKRMEDQRKMSIFEEDILELTTFKVDQINKPKPNKPIN